MGKIDPIWIPGDRREIHWSKRCAAGASACVGARARPGLRGTTGGGYSAMASKTEPPRVGKT